jgi:DNA repair protein RecO (recombination protein O)
MLEKTKGIVLHSIKYSDSGIVVNLYTSKFGRLSVLIRGIGRKKTGKHSMIFQPLFILDMEMYYKSSREIQLLKEYSLIYPSYNLISDIRKSSVAIFLGEVLSSVLGEETPNAGMFEYIEEAILLFEHAKDDYANFHIAFLTGLTRYLGIEPLKRQDKNEVFLDMRNGRFVKSPPSNGDYANENISVIISDFQNSTLNEAGKISLGGKQRNEILETLMKYYSIHLPSLKKINSLEILKEVFR